MPNYLINNDIENAENPENIWDNFLLSQKFEYPRQLPTLNNSVLDFCTNDYLGVNSIPEIKLGLNNHLINLIKNTDINIGATGSRLLSGNSQSHIKLEELIAKTKGSQNALIFNSGYQANASVLTAILKNLDTNKVKIFSDKANHASLHYVFQSLHLKQIRYAHNNLDHLEQRLKKYAKAGDYICIVTESVFGMDGDITDLIRLINIAANYNAMLYIDEAHATGILGNNGYGLASNLFNIYPNLIVMGTFSKAIGVSGGYIACSNIMKNYLINTCGGFIYSTAASHLLMEAVYYIWDKISTPYFKQLRNNLEATSGYIRKALQDLGFDIGISNSHIIPIILKDVEKSQKMHTYLIQNGIKTSHIRPPTVAPNTARIRLSLCANHTLNEVKQLVSIMQNLKRN